VILPVGTMLYGFCGGHFGRDSYESKRVEAVGADWVVCRDEDGGLWFAEGETIHTDLYEYTTQDEKARWST